MFKKISFIAAASLFLAGASLAKEPQNIDLLKAKLIRYHDSGDYNKDFTKAIDQSLEYLKLRLAREHTSPTHKKFAIVLDIDETSLSNYPDMLTLSFGGTMTEINEAEGAGHDPILQPILLLYQYAKKNHVAVFFVTGRTENYRVGTEKNLQAVGFKEWDGLIMKPENYNKNTAATYKIKARENIEHDGYTIILNVGDQKSDLIGKHAEKTIKLPNPFYIVP